MSTFLRIGSILLCLVAGVGAAIWLATSAGPAASESTPQATSPLAQAISQPKVASTTLPVANDSSTNGASAAPAIATVEKSTSPAASAPAPEFAPLESLAMAPLAANELRPAATESAASLFSRPRPLRAEPPVGQQVDDLFSDQPKSDSSKTEQPKNEQPKNELRTPAPDGSTPATDSVESHQPAAEPAKVEPAKVDPAPSTPAAPAQQAAPSPLEFKAPESAAAPAPVASTPAAAAAPTAVVTPPVPAAVPNPLPTPAVAATPAPITPPAPQPITPPAPAAISPNGNLPAANSSTTIPPTGTPAAAQNHAAGNKPNTRITNEGDNRLSLHLVDSDLREVFQLLSRGTGIAIMPSDAVQGTITASLPNVDFETAMSAILKTKGLQAKRDGNVIFVGTPEDFRKRELNSGKIATRLFRPNYINAAELQKLFTPLLTPQIGTITVTSPSQTGIASDSAVAGGDTYANSDVVLVRDYESVLAQIDRVFHEVDIKPLQVALEAMILSVKLSDKMEMGVNFAALRDNKHMRIVSGTPLSSLEQLATGDGLKVGFLDSSLAIFLSALETIGDTNVIATPRVLALNKMRAEILIGSQLGYVSTTVTETSTTQAVQFLEVGTQLRIRPFISSDGMVRMELHPELSTGDVKVQDGFTLPDKEVTGVTTNIMARDGSTVIIGGLIREDLSHTATQIPLLGSLPAVGALFRQKTETTDRREIIVLITPRIVCDSDMKREGDHVATEFHQRQVIQEEKFSPFSKTHLCKKYIYLAQQAWASDHQERALRLINLAIHFDPENRSAIDLRADIVNGVHFGDHTGQGPFLPSPEAQRYDDEEIDPRVLDELDRPVPEQLPTPQRSAKALRSQASASAGQTSTK